MYEMIEFVLFTIILYVLLKLAYEIGRLVEYADLMKTLEEFEVEEEKEEDGDDIA